MKKETWITMIICGIILLAAGGIYLYSGSAGSDDEFSASVWQEEGSDTIQTSSFPEETSASGTDSSSCTVYICGAVRHPGVYCFSANARVCDAVDAAGGFTKKAVQDSVNQARKLTDGEQITIPSVQSKKKNQSQGTNSPGQGASGGKVNINQADLQTLMTLSGIGEAKAQSIIDYRTENGPFSCVEDIMKISGIKQGVYNQLKENITVSD